MLANVADCSLKEFGPIEIGYPHIIPFRPLALPHRSPLLRESWLISLPPLIDMLTFGGLPRQIVNGGHGQRFLQIDNSEFCECLGEFHSDIWLFDAFYISNLFLIIKLLVIL